VLAGTEMQLVAVFICCCMLLSEIDKVRPSIEPVRPKFCEVLESYEIIRCSMDLQRRIALLDAQGQPASADASVVVSVSVSHNSAVTESPR
jgi:hypothetical protein